MRPNYVIWHETDAIFGHWVSSFFHLRLLSGEAPMKEISCCGRWLHCRVTGLFSFVPLSFIRCSVSLLSQVSVWDSGRDESLAQSRWKWVDSPGLCSLDWTGVSVLLLKMVSSQIWFWSPVSRVSGKREKPEIYFSPSNVDLSLLFASLFRL